MKDPEQIVEGIILKNKHGHNSVQYAFNND